jgi:uncharacterized membrane protein
VLPVLGDFVPAGAPLVHVKGRPRLDIESDVLRRVTLDTERSFAQDLAYGPRLLVDICVHSLERNPIGLDRSRRLRSSWRTLSW